MFVTALTMENLDCTKIDAQLENSQHVYGRGSFTSGSIRASPTSPPYASKQLTALFHTQPLLTSRVQHCSTTGKLCILVKVQPSTQRTWPLPPTRLGIRPRDLGLPKEFTLGHCGLSAASRHKLAFTSKQNSLLTATWHDSTLLNSFFEKKKS